MTDNLQNDPRLTAYALGELTPEEAAEVEAQWKENPLWDNELNAIRALAQNLTETLETEEIIMDSMDKNPETPSVTAELPKKKGHFVRNLLVAAALLAIVVGVGIAMNPEWISKFQPENLAQLDTPPTEKSQASAPDSELAPASEPSTAPVLESKSEVAEDSKAKEFKQNATVGEDRQIEEVAKDQVVEKSLAMPMEAAVEVPMEEPALTAAPVPLMAPAPAMAPVPMMMEDAEVAEDEEMRYDAIAEDSVEFYSQPVESAKKRSRVDRDEARAMMLASPQVMAIQEEEEMPAPEPSVAVPVPVVVAPDTNDFRSMKENEFQTPAAAPFSTFGVDVDTASYTVMRQALTERNRRPEPDSVRVEEYINYFDYNLAPPAEGEACPFATTVEIQSHPWSPGLLMAKVSLKGRVIPDDKRPKLNLVFLLDVSGSMSDWNKLPLVKVGMLKLLEQLGPEDRISIVTYASTTGVLLQPTAGNERQTIEKAILGLNAEGGTYGEGGIRIAYECAKKNFDKDAQNRVILCTDGDFNIGTTDDGALEDLIQTEAKSGVFLTILGFGMGNYHDARMKLLASKGNGNYGYIDSQSEATRMLCEKVTSTLITIAKDVKLQIEFNPAKIAAYRLVGYEHRKLEDRDFNDDRKDSGDIGAGHSVTALYELVPVGVDIPNAGRVDAPRYQAPAEAEKPAEAAKPAAVDSPECMFVKLRYKLPEASESTLVEVPVVYEASEAKAPSPDFQFATGVALYAMLLRDSDYTYDATMDTVLELIRPAIGEDSRRAEFETLVKKAKDL